MSRLPRMRYSDIVSRLRKAGFVFDRQAKGSHEIWYNAETGRRTTVPHHAGDIPPGTIRAIIRGTGLSVEDFLDIE
jgi:predicted RNA binding protein YcfA (HicA-like mRNA interferase family)